MQDVILNMANVLLISYCFQNDIDCSDSRIVKNGRGFKYSLVGGNNDREFATIIFSKSSVPNYSHRERTN